MGRCQDARPCLAHPPSPPILQPAPHPLDHAAECPDPTTPTGDVAGVSPTRRITLLAVLAGAPGVAVALLLLWTGDHSPRLQWTLTVLLAAARAMLVATLRERTIRPIQTLANLLSALHEGDYSMRPVGGPTDDVLGLAFREVQALSQTLREQRLGAFEATALLRKVMAEIDVALFTFDHQRKLRLVNRAGERRRGRVPAAVAGAEMLRPGLRSRRTGPGPDGGPGPLTRARAAQA